MGIDRTQRQEISDLLTSERLTAREISQSLRLREREVIEHLEHILKSISKKGYFRIEPSECRKCGFVFKNRKRLKSPGRCPLCKNEAITEPRFWIENKR